MSHLWVQIRKKKGVSKKVMGDTEAYYCPAFLFTGKRCWSISVPNIILMFPKPRPEAGKLNIFFLIWKKWATGFQYHYPVTMEELFCLMWVLFEENPCFLKPIFHIDHHPLKWRTKWRKPFHILGKLYKNKNQWYSRFLMSAQNFQNTREPGLATPRWVVPNGLILVTFWSWFVHWINF